MMCLGGWHPWPGGVVPYCYQPMGPTSGQPQPGSALYEASVDMVEDALAKYEAVPNANIDFQGGGLCAHWDDYVIGTDPDTLRIMIRSDDAAYRECNVGSIAGGFYAGHCPAYVCTSRERVLVFGANYNGDGSPAIMHELGHALGFMHEHARLTGTLPERCAKDDITSPDLGVTRYDRSSIMNATYCNQNTELSPVDEAGLAYVYPGSNSDQLSLPGSFPLPAGRVTWNGNARVEFSLQLAGVQEFVFDEAEWFVGSNTTPIGSGSALNVASAVALNASAVIQAAFTDMFGRARMTQPLTVRRDPGLFAALVLSTN